MTVEIHNFNLLIDRLRYFLSDDFSKAKSIYMIKGEGKVEAAISCLTLMMFASDKGKGIFDMVTLAIPDIPKEYFGMVSQMKEIAFNDSNTQMSPFMNEQQAIWYSKRKDIPYAVLFVGHVRDSNLPLVVLNTLKSVNPEVVFKSLQEQCREQFKSLNQSDQV